MDATTSGPEVNSINIAINLTSNPHSHGYRPEMHADNKTLIWSVSLHQKNRHGLQVNNMCLKCY